LCGWGFRRVFYPGERGSGDGKVQIMDELHWDVETRSEVDLEIVGLDNYYAHPSTELIMSQHAINGGKVHLWQPHLNPKPPAELVEALEDPFVIANAWGAQFERKAAARFLGIKKPINEWRCSMVRARYFSLPGGLEDAGRLLGLKESEAKIEDGKRLIQKFCSPEIPGGEITLFGLSTASYRNWNTDPEDWDSFCKYGVRDVEAERIIGTKKLKDFSPPDHEWETWFLDQEINERGWPVDMPLVSAARALVLRELEPLNRQLKELTGLANPNSRNQMLDWLEGQGYIFTSLNKDFVARALDGECQLTDIAKRVLDIRSQTSKSSVSKYTALADMTSEDGRLRHQYTFYGAHTGRWAAHGVNMGNLVKATKEVDKKLELAVELVRKMDFDRITKEFSKPLEVAAGVQRSAFRAPEGKKFVVADLNAIENRGLGYLARCEAILKVFREGKDPYLDFATRMYNEPYDRLLAEYEAGDKSKRTICKAPVLGAGYGLGPGKEEWVDGNLILTGLRGYADKMGVEMTGEEATYAIQVFRESYPEVKQLWKDMERAAAFAIRNPGQIVGVGEPHTKRDEEYFTEIGRKVLPALVSFKCTGSRVLEMLLPSGRSLHYIDPRVAKEEKVWKFKDPHTGEPRERKYQQDVVYYKAKDQKTKQWVEVDTWGGPFVENADQAICRDVLVHGMKLADKKGFEVVGSTYDEAITVADINGLLGLPELIECLISPVPWAGDAFPLGADGFEGLLYRKN